MLGPATALASSAVKSSNVNGPEYFAPRPTPTLPLPVIEPSCRSNARSGLLLHEPSDASHCCVSERNAITCSSSPWAIRLTRSHCELKYEVDFKSPRTAVEPLTTLTSWISRPRVMVTP